MERQEEGREDEDGRDSRVARERKARREGGREGRKGAYSKPQTRRQIVCNMRMGRKTDANTHLYPHRNHNTTLGPHQIPPSHQRGSLT